MTSKSPLRAICSLVPLVLSILAATAASADIVHLRSGDTLQGRLSPDSLTISSPSHGELVIPVASIVRLRFLDGGAEPERIEVELVDGTMLSGRLLTDRLLLDRDLFSNALDLATVEEIVIEGRREPLTIPAGTPVPVMLAERLHSKTAAPGQEVAFCVAEDVRIGDEVAFSRGTPVLGTITQGQGAARMSQQGEITVEPDFLLLGGERRLGLQGTGAEFKGGLDPGAFIGAGVFGFLARGQEVEIPPGAVVAMETDSELRLDPPLVPDEGGARDRCRELFRFADVETIRYEDVDPQGFYAPLGTSMAISIPLDGLERGSISRSFRNLEVYDTYVQVLRLTVAGNRSKAKLQSQVFLVVRPSHDKRVDLELTLVDGETVLATAVEKDIDAEEEKSKEVRTTLIVDRAALDRALEAGTARLLVSLSVRQ